MKDISALSKLSKAPTQAVVSYDTNMISDRLKSFSGEQKQNRDGKVFDEMCGKLSEEICIEIFFRSM